MSEKKKEEKEKKEHTPFLVTDAFIAEEGYNKKDETVYFYQKYFNSNAIDIVEKIEYNGVVYYPLYNSTLKKRLVLLPNSISESSFEEAYNEGCKLTLEMYDCEKEKEDEVKFLVAIAQSSFFLDRFNIQIPGMGAFAPIIALRGPSGSGKDRLMNALRLNSYRPFYDVSTRRIPSLYRPLDQWKGTLCLSEMDFKGTTETSELTHYLNCRSYGVPISRQNPENPKYNEVFYNFGLTLVTQRRVWDDNALEDRTLPFYCEKSQKEIPTEELDEWVERGLKLQSKLMYLRLKYYDQVVIDKSARIPCIKDHRLIASVLPLLALSKIDPSFKVLDQVLISLERKRREVKAMSKDGVILNELYEMWKNGLIGEHNGIKYIAKEKAKIKDKDILIPLQTSDLSEKLKWTTKEVRNVINSLQLHPFIEKLPKFVYLDRSYRPIFFDEERLKSRFSEFVPDYDITNITHITDNPSDDNNPRTENKSVISVMSVREDSNKPTVENTGKQESQCGVCDETFPSLNELVKHIKEEHKNE